MSNIPYYKIGILIISLHLFALCAIYGAQMQRCENRVQKGENTPAPMVLRFESQSWDFGDIAEDGGDVEHTFHFTNVSDSPVDALHPRSRVSLCCPTIRGR